MKNGIKIIIILFMSTWLFQSCLNDSFEDCMISDKSIALKLVVSMPEEVQTRAGETGTTEDGDFEGNFNENVINTLDIFFFNGETCMWYPENVSYDAVAGKAIIPIPADKIPLLDGTVNFAIYVVANGPARVEMEGKTLTALKEIVISGNFLTNGLAPQPKFVMDGVINKTVSMTNPDLGTVNLKRALAKIRIRITKGGVINNILNGAVFSPQVSIRSYNTQGTLMEISTIPYLLHNDMLYKPASKDLSIIPGLNLTGLTTLFPLYSYPNDWNTDLTKETYVMIKVPFTVEGVTNDYYYKIPVNYQAPEGPQPGKEMFYRLQRNHLYDVLVNINRLGGTIEEPVEITGNYTIKDWTTREVYGSITAQQYLVVSEQVIKMNNTNSYQIKFSSSKAPVSIKPGSLKASYTYIDVATGNPVTGNYASGNDQFPTITLTPNASGTITINSMIPVNYIPKDIEFIVQNGITGLDLKVIIQQYPSNYFTTEKGTKSSLRNQLDPAHTNPYMYIMSSLVPNSNTIWGFPPLDSEGNTVNSLEVSKMISPKFMMASQLGATSTMGYTAGKTNCADYWEETVKNGATVRYDDWRLPTEAEIKLIDDLQHDSNNPQGVVMRGNYYWDSYSGNNAYLMKNPITTSGNSTSAHVRCIRDIKN